MAEQDSLRSFDFSKVMDSGIFLKFIPDEPIVLRILTTDPVVYSSEYTDRKTEEITINTKFAFIVYNWTEGKAQIMRATPRLAKDIAELHEDEDYEANIKKIDVKITPPAKNEIKAYEIKAMMKTKTLSAEQIKECQAIDLDAQFPEGSRMHLWHPKDEPAKEDEPLPENDQEEPLITDVGEEVNLDDIPF